MSGGAVFPDAFDEIRSRGPLSWKRSLLTRAHSGGRRPAHPLGTPLPMGEEAIVECEALARLMLKTISRLPDGQAPLGGRAFPKALEVGPAIRRSSDGSA